MSLPPGIYLDARLRLATERDAQDRGHSREVMIKAAELQLDSLKNALAPRLVEMFVKDYNDEAENLADMLQTLDFWLPVRDVAVTGGSLRADEAVLDVEGTLASGVRALTLVRMIKGPSQWLFESATMAGMLP